MLDSDWLKFNLRLIFPICVQTQILCNRANVPINEHPLQCNLPSHPPPPQKKTFCTMRCAVSLILHSFCATVHPYGLSRVHLWLRVSICTPINCGEILRSCYWGILEFQFFSLLLWVWVAGIGLHTNVELNLLVFTTPIPSP